MTMRQVYQHLARVMATRTGDVMFCQAKKVTAADLKAIQAALLLILEKIDYDRAHYDFGAAFRAARGAPLEAIPQGDYSVESIERTLREMSGVNRSLHDARLLNALFVDEGTGIPESNA